MSAASEELEKGQKHGSKMDATDEAELARMGYKQELKYALSLSLYTIYLVRLGLEMEMLI